MVAQRAQRPGPAKRSQKSASTTRPKVFMLHSVRIHCVGRAAQPFTGMAPKCHALSLDSIAAQDHSFRNAVKPEEEGLRHCARQRESWSQRDPLVTLFQSSTVHDAPAEVKEHTGKREDLLVFLEDIGSVSLLDRSRLTRALAFDWWARLALPCPLEHLEHVSSVLSQSVMTTCVTPVTNNTKSAPVTILWWLW